MTIDWANWEDEIRRLYVTQRLSLQTVRGILLQRGFNPSIRAYRMKLKEWGIQKNSRSLHKRQTIISAQSPKPVRAIQHKETTVQDPPPLSYNVAEDSQSKTDFDSRMKSILLADYNFTLPDHNLTVDELFACLPEELKLYDYDYLLGILLMKWQPDGLYLQAAKEYLESSYNYDYDYSYIGNGFKLIDDRLGPHEKNKLTLLILERDLLYSGAVNSIPDIGGYREWCNLARSGYYFSEFSWAEVKVRLQDDDLNAENMGQSFVDCAPIAASQKRLETLRHLLENFVYRYKEDEDSNDNTNLKMSYFYKTRTKYMEILDDFPYKVSGLDVDQEYYKFAIQMHKWHEKHQESKLQSLSKKLQDAEQELNHLKEQNSVRRQEVRDKSSKSSPTIESEVVAGRTTSDQIVSAARSIDAEVDEDVQPDKDLRTYEIERANQDATILLSKPSPSANPKDIFQDLLQTWQAGRGLFSKVREYNLNTLTLVNRDEPISKRDPNDLFALIQIEVPRPNRAQFCHDLFEAFGQNAQSFISMSANLEYWWTRLYDASDWSRFQDASKHFNVWASSNDISNLTSDAIICYTAVIVGKRLINKYSPFCLPGIAGSASYREKKLAIATDLLEAHIAWAVDEKLRGPLG